MKIPDFGTNNWTYLFLNLTKQDLPGNGIYFEKGILFMMSY